MANGIFLTIHAAQQNIDALNRKCKSTVDVENGTAVTMTLPTEGDWDVFVAEKAEEGTDSVGIACSPEVNKLAVGQVYGGADPRYFTNVANKAYDVVIPQKYDAFLMSIDCFAEGFDPASVSGATMVELGENGWEAVVSATESYTGIAFNLGQEHDIMVGNEAVKAWVIECVNN